jgi:hypothetical protein
VKKFAEQKSIDHKNFPEKNPFPKNFIGDFLKIPDFAGIYSTILSTGW